MESRVAILRQIIFPPYQGCLIFCICVFHFTVFILINAPGALQFRSKKMTFLKQNIDAIFMAFGNFERVRVLE